MLGGLALVASACGKAAVAPAGRTAALFASRPEVPPADAPLTSSPSTSTSDARPPTSRTLDVPVYYQAFALSCEAASLRMVLAYRGIDTTDAAILDAIGADTSPPVWEAGRLRWGDPYSSFVGWVDGSEIGMTGYGTYHPPIASAATSLGGHVLAGGEGISPDALYALVLDGMPAVAWVTYQWVTANRDDYTAFDGAQIPYAGPVEHAVAVVGVSADSVVVNDPDFGRYAVDKATFEAAYATYNRMAVILG